MVINIYRISYPKSKPENRIDAMMDSGEHVIISRRYGVIAKGIPKEHIRKYGFAFEGKHVLIG